MRKLTATVFAAACLVATGSQAALAISDAGFESAAAFTEVDTTFTDADNALNAWVIYGDTYDGNNKNWTKPSSGGDPDGYAMGAIVGGGSYKRTMYQAVEDNKATQGFNDLSFDLNLNEGVAGSVGLQVAIWGIVDSSSSFSFSTTGTAVMDANVGSAVLLDSLTITENTTGWETVTMSDIDFGTGYDLVVIGFKENNYRTDQDILGIDNVAVGAVPEPGSLALIGLGGLLIARRRH